MRITKKITSIVLAVLMVVSMMSVMAVTASAATYYDTEIFDASKLQAGDIIVCTDDGYNVMLDSYAEITLKAGTYLQENSDLVADTDYVYTDSYTGPFLSGNGFTGDHQHFYNAADSEGVWTQTWYVIDVKENEYDDKSITIGGHVPAPTTPTASTAAELTAAIANAQNGDTIKLAADITLDSPITVDKEITIDGGSYTVTSAGTIFDVAATGKLTLKDGTYSDTTENENWESFGYTINTAGELIIDGAAVTSTDIAAISAVDGTVTVNSGSVTGAHYAIYNMGADVVINGGTFVSNSRTSKSNGSAVPDYAIGQEAGKTTVNGGTIKGFGGIIVNGGDLKVTDGSIDTSANTNSWRPIHIASAYAEINAEITGGTFKAYKEAIYVQNGANGQSVAISGGSFTTTRSKTASNFVDKTNGDIAVSGGTFNRPVGIDQCANNAAPKDNGDKTYTVQLGDYVAKTNKGKYETLAEAVDAAQNGDTIKLLKDVTLSESLEIPAEKSFTLDLNGYDISGNVNDQMIKNNGTVVVDDTSITHGHIYNTNIEKQGNAAFVNYGTATVKNGYFGDKNSDMTDANDVNRGAGFQNYGTAVIDGGYFTACDNFTNPEGGDIGYAYAIINYGNITINDATVYGKNNGNLANDEGTMVVNGGDFSLNKLEKNVYYSIYNGSADAATTVNGGTFNNGGKALTYTGEGTMDITGGNFTFDKLEQSTGNSSIFGGTFSKRVESRCCADGYIAVENGDGTFGVAQDDNPLNSLLRKASEIADNNLFKLNNDYYCGTLLGVQKKAAISGASTTSEDGKQEAAEGNDMRFVAVLETNLLRKADDYGFVLAKVGSDKNTTNTNFDNLKMGDDRAKTISAKGTYNNILIKNATNGLKYGDPAANTAYKYVTCAVNGVSTTEKVVARFYVTINGKTYYAKYAGHDYQYTGCTAGVNSKGNIV